MIITLREGNDKIESGVPLRHDFELFFRLSVHGNDKGAFGLLCHNATDTDKGRIGTPRDAQTSSEQVSFTCLRLNMLDGVGFESPGCIIGRAC